MIAFLTLLYIAILALAVKMGWVRWTTFWKVSPVLFGLLLMVLLFIPMQFFAPEGAAVVIRHTVQIVPNVTGQVIEVPVHAYQPISQGDVLFRIDPLPYQAAVDGIQAQLVLAQQRLDQARRLFERQAGSAFEVEGYETQLASLEAQLANAEYNLRETVVRAPTDGHLTNLAIRPGARVMSAPLTQAMAFVDDSEVMIAAQVHQIYLRHVQPGQPVEVVLKTLPGQILHGKVLHVVSDLATGQVAPSGALPIPQQIQPAPFYVRIQLDDEELAQTLPTGAAGKAAIYTGEFEISYMIRNVMMRMDAWLNYVIPA